MVVSADFECTALWTIIDGDVEDDRSDLDHIIITKDGSLYSLAVEMRADALVEGLKDRTIAILGNPAVPAGDLW